MLSAAARAGEPSWPAVEREATALLQECVRIDTTNPPGNVVPVVGLLERTLAREGIAAKRYVADAARGHVNLLARLPGRGAGKPLLMLAHTDVVPAVPSRWKLPPFSGTIRDGELWGRGAIDMKGLGIIELTAMILLKREGFVPARDLLLLFDCDEETGGDDGAKWMTDRHYGELDPAYVLDEGSSGSEGIYTADGRTVFGVSVDEKKVLWLKLVAKGETGHGSMPGPHNAVESLIRAAGRVPGLSPAPRDTPLLASMRRTLGALADNPVTRSLSRTTVTVTSLKAGVGEPPKVNVIPGIAEATIDCRLLPEDSASAMIAAVRGVIDDPAVTLEVLHAPADVTPPPWDTPLYRAIADTVSGFVPSAVTLPVILTGGTDARYFRGHGVPAYGFEPMVRTPEEEELMHGDDERIRLSEFARGIRMERDLLRRFLR